VFLRSFGRASLLLHSSGQEASFTEHGTQVFHSGCTAAAAAAMTTLQQAE